MFFLSMKLYAIKGIVNLHRVSNLCKGKCYVLKFISLLTYLIYCKAFTKGNILNTAVDTQIPNSIYHGGN